MVKDTKTGRAVVSAKLVTKPLGKGKATRFAAVEGMKKSATTKALASKLVKRGLKGDAFRKEVAKAFKKA